MDLAWPSVVRPTPARGSEVGTANGVRYHRRYEKSKWCRGGDALETSFFPAGEDATSLIWHFGAEVCNTEQRRRVDDLLFRVARIGLPLQRPRYRAELPTVAEVTGFKLGTPVADVVAKLGDPGFSSCEERGGFTVGYAAKHGDSYREWNVRFDAQQGFVSAKRTHPGY
jgi:hypothetical protein